MRFVKPFIFFLCLSRFAFALEEVTFDRGKKGDPRNFQSADSCQSSPCILSQRGAIRFDKKITGTHNIELGYIHEEVYSPFTYFQAASTLDEKVTQRLFNKSQNREVFNLERALRLGEEDTVHVYGMLLHYNVDEGDLFVVTLTDDKNPKKKSHTYFRYHKDGPIWDVDVGILAPINYFRPNPNRVIRGARIALGLSTTLGWYMDPERRYSFGGKLLHSFKLNMVGGLMSRRELVSLSGDQIVDDNFDGFVGGGFTFLDLIIAGVGVNLVRSPHAIFPYAGLEVKHFYQFIKSLKKSTKKRWNHYLTEEGRLNL